MTESQRQRLLEGIELASTTDELELAKSKLQAYDEAQAE